MAYTLQSLLNRIKKYNEAYRNGTPIVSDSEYDNDIATLKAIDPNNEWFSHIEPSPVSNGRKRKLPLPMKSLNKVKNLTELQKWLIALGLNKGTQLVLMPKFDGLSLLHNEQTGEAWSRGGSENEGQDCTEHSIAAGIQSYTRYLYTYGEFIITRKDWKDFFDGKRSSYTGELYKSPRNTAAGFLNRDTPCQEIAHTSFYRYGIDDTTLYNNFDNFHEVLEVLNADYTQPGLFEKVSSKTLSEEHLHALYKEWNKTYPIDGIVVYIDDLHIWKTIGRHQTTGNPLYAIAYKHPDFTDSFETTVKSVSWKASKSGALKPVVNIDCVNTGDCNMENPTGYNAKWIKENHIAKGASILVTRSGGVIPKILQTLQNAPTNEEKDMWYSLSTCSYCGSETVWNESGVELCCPNPECPGKILAEIVFFYTTCGAEGIGEELLSKLYNAGYASIHAMLNITGKELLQIEGVAEGIATIVLDNNQKIMEGVEATTLMQASNCFSGIGKVKAAKLLGELNDKQLAQFYDCKLELQETSGLPKTKIDFINGLHKFYKFIKETQIPIKHIAAVNINTNGVCSGLSVCMSGFRDSKMEEFIKANGGSIASSVSKKTSMLVVLDKSGHSSKISKAESLNIPILSINEFTEKYHFCGTENQA